MKNGPKKSEHGETSTTQQRVIKKSSNSQRSCPPTNRKPRDPAMKLPPIQKKTPTAPRTGVSNGPPRARHASGDKVSPMRGRSTAKKVNTTQNRQLPPPSRETFTQLLNQSQANGAPTTAVSPGLPAALPSETTPSPDINNRTRTQSEASSKPSEAGTYDRPSSPPDHNQFNEQPAAEHGEFRHDYAHSQQSDHTDDQIGDELREESRFEPRATDGESVPDTPEPQQEHIPHDVVERAETPEGERTVRELNYEHHHEAPKSPDQADKELDEEIVIKKEVHYDQSAMPQHEEHHESPRESPDQHKISITQDTGDETGHESDNERNRREIEHEFEEKLDIHKLEPNYDSEQEHVVAETPHVQTFREEQEIHEPAESRVRFEDEHEDHHHEPEITKEDVIEAGHELREAMDHQEEHDDRPEPEHDMAIPGPKIEVTEREWDEDGAHIEQKITEKEFVDEEGYTHHVTTTETFIEKEHEDKTHSEQDAFEPPVHQEYIEEHIERKFNDEHDQPSEHRIPEPAISESDIREAAQELHQVVDDHIPHEFEHNVPEPAISDNDIREAAHELHQALDSHSDHSISENDVREAAHELHEAMSDHHQSSEAVHEPEYHITDAEIAEAGHELREAMDHQEEHNMAIPRPKIEVTEREWDEDGAHIEQKITEKEFVDEEGYTHHVTTTETFIEKEPEDETHNEQEPLTQQEYTEEHTERRTPDEDHDQRSEHHFEQEMPHHEERQEEFHHESPKAASPVHEPSDDHHSLKSHESFDQHISVIVEKIEKDSSEASGSPLGPDHVNVSDETEHEEHDVAIPEPKTEVSEKEWDEDGAHIEQKIVDTEYTDDQGYVHHVHQTETYIERSHEDEPHHEQQQQHSPTAQSDHHDDALDARPISASTDQSAQQMHHSMTESFYKEHESDQEHHLQDPEMVRHEQESPDHFTEEAQHQHHEIIDEIRQEHPDYGTHISVTMDTVDRDGAESQKSSPQDIQHDSDGHHDTTSESDLHHGSSEAEMHHDLPVAVDDHQPVTVVHEKEWDEDGMHVEQKVVDTEYVDEDGYTHHVKTTETFIEQAHADNTLEDGRHSPGFYEHDYDEHLEDTASVKSLKSQNGNTEVDDGKNNNEDTHSMKSSTVVEHGEEDSENANNGDANGLKPTNGDVTHEEDEKDNNVSATVA
ncbi:hypothetical protein WR25_04541 isoform B [Diploscapter pachys]|nr:hypothetical protein WR25_04541 isoform B [Diploscapter pachys]